MSERHQYVCDQCGAVVNSPKRMGDCYSRPGVWLSYDRKDFCSRKCLVEYLGGKVEEEK